ncbi:MAG: hypothetical protein WDW36_007357 [Sanguina aurantia]
MPEPASPAPSSRGSANSALSSSLSERIRQRSDIPSREQDSKHHKVDFGLAQMGGEAPRMQIVFRDLVYKVQVKEKGKKGLVTREILRGLNGVIQPSRATAVMGASGAGKTTLLNILAGHVGGAASVTGSISVNGETVTPERMRLISGFVHQEDVILETMTVREALLFAAMLKLPGSMPTREKLGRALDIAEMLNLKKSLDSIVGNSLIQGISGGEKRRLSLGMEMITNPSILYLDEPTSGLDTYTSYKVAKILSSVSHRHHRTVVCTIHQPSSDIFHEFDDLIVLAEGQILYQGLAEKMVEYFGSIGYVCPHYTNPADYLFMDILNTSTKGNDAAFDFMTRASAQDLVALEGHKARVKSAEEGRMSELVASWHKSAAGKDIAQMMADPKMLITTGISSQALQQQASIPLQFHLLALRSGKNMWRNSLILKAKLAQTVFLSVIVALIFLHIKPDLVGVQDREGSLFFIVVSGIFSSLTGTLTVFGAEKVVFTREYGSRMYSLFAFFSSRWLVELPTHIILPIVSSCIMYWIIGYQNTATKFWWFALANVLIDNCGAALGMFVACLFNDIAVALAVMPMFMMPLMIFSGFFVNMDSLHPYFHWIPYISPMRYGFIVLAQNEFSGLVINCSPEQKCAPGYSGESVISLLGFDSVGGIEQNLGILFAMMCGLIFLAYIALWNAVRPKKQ